MDMATAVSFPADTYPAADNDFRMCVQQKPVHQSSESIDAIRAHFAVRFPAVKFGHRFHCDCIYSRMPGNLEGLDWACARLSINATSVAVCSFCLYIGAKQTYGQLLEVCLTSFDV